MKFNVFMLGFAKGEIRIVDVPDEELNGNVNNDLELIFHYGQNDFQPISGKYSVSIGDVAVYNGDYYLVKATSWKKISSEELEERKEEAQNSSPGSNAFRNMFSGNTKNNKEITKMSKFNLGGYLKKLLSSKKKDKQGNQIETKLNVKNKKEEVPQELTEKLLQKHRKDTEETIMEKKLEKVRSGSQEVLVEGQLNKSKNTIVKHRNEATAKGNISKLEEKRLKGETMESEKQEPASEVDKPRRFWEAKSPDGLKLAKSIKISQALDYDIDMIEDELPRQTPDFKEKLSPETLMELDQLNRQDKEFKEKEGDDTPEEIKTMAEDIISDPDMLNDVFSEEVIGQDDSTGTTIEERKIEFDLKDADGEIRAIFKSTIGVSKDVLKKAIVNFIRLNHDEESVDENALDIEIDDANFTGMATYIVPVA